MAASLLNPVRPRALATALRYLAAIGLTFLAYYAAARIGLAAPFTSFNVSPVWPAAGLAPVILHLGGRRLWPGIFAAAFTVNFVTGLPGSAATAIAVGNTLSALVGAWLLHRYISREMPLHRLRDVVPLVALVATTGPVVAATFGVSGLLISGVQPWTAFSSAWLVWWLGDAMGILLVIPVLLTLRDLPLAVRAGSLLAVNVGAAATMTFLIFDAQLVNEDVLAFLVFPFVIWAALRFKVAGAAAVVLAIAAVAVWQTAQGDGPFVHREPAFNVAMLQLFLAVISVTGLLLGAMMSERVRAEDLLEREQALRRADVRAAESESKFRAVAESAAIGIYIHDGTRLLYVNPAVERITGYTRDEILSMKMWDIVHPEFRALMQGYTIARFRGDPAPERYEFKIVTKNGEERSVDFTGCMVQFDGKRCVLATALDISERKLAEEVLRTSERLATAGRMAAAIAHEINNPLEAMSNLIYLLESSPKLHPDLREYAQMAGQSLERVAQVARQTLSFYRDSTNPVPVRISELTDSVLEFYAPKLSSAGIQVHRSYGDGDVLVGYAGELRQLFSNLLVNAIDAIGSGGCIHIRVAAVGNDGQSNAKVKVLFADDGPGIPQPLRPRIFDPFFTTKGNGGTGLGLWVGLGVVQKHGGSIRVRSGFLNGRGTAFRILLSAARVEGANQSAAPAAYLRNQKLGG